MKKSIIFYDSECIMCSRFALMVFKYDKYSSIYFSGLDSDLFKSIKQNTQKIIPDQTVVFYKNQTDFYYKSEAVLQICKLLKFPLNLFVVFDLLPTSLLNSIYGFVALKRRSWFKKSDEKCALIQAKFLERVIK
jgi:predicted DCC family thiol-disulfide oxidoreductase YuxK